MMFATFLARVRPASTNPNPACIKNTKMPAMNTHRLSRTRAVSSLPSSVGGGSSCAAAGSAQTTRSVGTNAPTINSLRLMVSSPVD